MTALIRAADYGGGPECDGFELRNLRQMPKLSEKLQRAKHASEEADYLRFSRQSEMFSKYDRAR